ncbi:thiamine-phosphate kinase [Thaumasiovibrio subtropicus]|uniref:thiamine-phosphate kinase n=1 Tax=Thaumasiovibrio subtropicus TaxID=1891207 RepID=UPI000B34CF4D|nr:thiamine-phosphate kinase [Thaumasiovibrio subtropicus]
MTSAVKTEFGLIETYFNQQGSHREDVDLAIGDDGALMTVPDGHQLVVSTDTMVLGTHFLSDADPAWVGHKALSSNLSDIIAMGATPTWVSLALTLPAIDEQWLQGFCDGFFTLAKDYNVTLVGGDTTSGPLAITVTIHGTVPRGEAWLRCNAKVGDKIYVSAELGDSQAGLDYVLDPRLESDVKSTLLSRHFRRYPPLSLVKSLSGKICCALDISDGLIADLGHILKASQVGAVIDADKLPLSAELITHCEGDEQRAKQMALASGEEYALCFTAPAALELHDLPVHCIGHITDSAHLEITTAGKPVTWPLKGYDHFGKTDES